MVCARGCRAQVVFPQNQYVTKYDYDEFGPNVIHRKCGEEGREESSSCATYESAGFAGWWFIFVVQVKKDCKSITNRYCFLFDNHSRLCFQRSPCSEAHNNARPPICAEGRSVFAMRSQSTLFEKRSLALLVTLLVGDHNSRHSVMSQAVGYCSNETRRAEYAADDRYDQRLHM
eukprot:6985253-Pyramimonas_sp.AAC.2